MSNKVITIFYTNSYNELFIMNIPYSKEWMDKLKIASGTCVPGVYLSIDNVINEIEQRVTILDNFTDPCVFYELLIPPEETGSWQKYIIKNGTELSFHSEGIFVINY